MQWAYMNEVNCSQSQSQSGKKVHSILQKGWGVEFFIMLLHKGFFPGILQAPLILYADKKKADYL